MPAMALDAPSPLPAFGVTLAASAEKVPPSPASSVSKSNAGGGLPLAFGLRRADDSPSPTGKVSPQLAILGTPSSRDAEKASWHGKVAELYEERSVLLRTVSRLEEECSRYRSMVKAQDSTQATVSSDAGSDGAESPVKREVRLLKSHVANLQRQVEESTTRAQDAERRAAGSARALRVASLRAEQLEGQVSGGETPSAGSSKLAMELAAAREKLASQASEVEDLRKQLDEAVAASQVGEQAREAADTARIAAEREKEATEQTRRALEEENVRLKNELAEATSRTCKAADAGVRTQEEGSSPVDVIEVAALVNELKIAMDHSVPGERDPAKVLSSVLATLEDTLHDRFAESPKGRSSRHKMSPAGTGPASRRAADVFLGDNAAGPSPQSTRRLSPSSPVGRGGTPQFPPRSFVERLGSGRSLPEAQVRVKVASPRSGRPSERSPGRDRPHAAARQVSGQGRGIPFHSSSRLNKKVSDGFSTPVHSMSIRH
mmetsp:Transcript_697/g.1543  ORF Transcript_697/g.1543 Transcript_697/m.1543 type:complete len:490 (+) Transcript_697:28-1497(+)